MDIQLPEPNFYTLAEVAQRWEVSEDVLLRLGAEGKLNIGIESMFCDVNIEHTVNRSDDDSDEFTYQVGPREAKEIDIVWPPHLIGNLFISQDSIRRLIKKETVNGPLYVRPIEMNDRIAALSKGYEFSVDDWVISRSQLIIPTSEIHRLEHQHEAAKKANAEDVLGTRERETMQAVIAAMTQFIAGTGAKYKRNERPNVDAISGALKDVIPDRTKRGISETISRALKAGLIRT